MSTGNGHDPLTVEMVEILRGISARLDQTNARLDTLHEDMIVLQVEVKGVRTEMNSLRTELHADLDDMRGDYGARLARLEAAVFKPAAE